MKTTSFVLMASTLALPTPAQLAGPGYALSFDGSGASVSIQTTGSLTGTFTVELWANPNDPTSACGLIGSRSPQDCSFDSVVWLGLEIGGDIGNGSHWIRTSANGFFPYSIGR